MRKTKRFSITLPLFFAAASQLPNVHEVYCKIQGKMFADSPRQLFTDKRDGFFSSSCPLSSLEHSSHDRSILLPNPLCFHSESLQKATLKIKKKKSKQTTTDVAKISERSKNRLTNKQKKENNKKTPTTLCLYKLFFKANVEIDA